MVLMPLTGWAILSAHSPPGSPGALVEFAAPPVATVGFKPGSARPQAMPARPSGPPPTMKIWSVVPMPKIALIEAVGREPGGVAPQHVLHEEFVAWHSVGGYLLIGLLILHILGALKHQFIDKQREFARMGVGRRRLERGPPPNAG
jgi:cytochrome b561